jgi:serine/threonine-protein kinase RsbW
MGALLSAARALVGHSTGPASLLALLHQSWDHLGIDHIATCIVARLDPATGALQVATAGHPPPLAIGPYGVGYLPVEPSPPLGSPTTDIPEYVDSLVPGTVLLFYTDGLIEDRSTSLQQGLARLASVAANSPNDPGPLCDRLLSEFGRGRSDDIALLAVRLDG